MLALFAILVVGAVVVLLAALILAAQSDTRSSTGFEQALQGAETGLDRMTAQVKQNPFAVGVAPIVGTDAATGVQYSTTATPRLDVAGQPSGQWTLTSVGTDDRGATRTVEVTLSAPGLFRTAAFGKFFVDFNGGNGADSFDSDSGPSGRYICSSSGTGPSTDYRDVVDDFDVRMCNPTRAGTVATNGRLRLDGQSADDTDRAEIHFARENVVNPLDGATGYCDGVPELCNQYTPTASPDYPDGTTPPGGLYYYRDAIALPAVTDCPGDASGNFAGIGTLGPGTHYYVDVTLTSATVTTGTPGDPTIICVSGTVTIPDHEAVNVENGGNGKRVPRPPGSLYILSKVNSTSTPALDFGNHASISAAIYAPGAAFKGGSQGNIYGSLVAASVDNNGGWNFHYDQALRHSRVNTPVYVSRWVEKRS